MTDENQLLAEGLKRGDREATDAVRHRVRKVLAFRGYGIPTEERRDLEQIVLVQLWEAVDRPGFDASRFWGLVEVLTARRCVDWLRRRRPLTVEVTEALPDPQSRPDESAIARQRLEVARSVLKELPATCRQLLDLHVAKGLSYREISRLLGKSEGALRVQMTRCIQRAATAIHDRTEEL